MSQTTHPYVQRSAGAPLPDHAAEFDCTDCRAHVVAFGLKVCLVPPLCATCAWLAAEFQDDPVGREAVRAALECRPAEPVLIDAA